MYVTRDHLSFKAYKCQRAQKLSVLVTHQYLMRLLISWFANFYFQSVANNGAKSVLCGKTPNERHSSNQAAEFGFVLKDTKDEISNLFVIIYVVFTTNFPDPFQN